MTLQLPPWLEQLWHDFVRDVQANRVFLPSMPEVALRTRRLLQDPKMNSAGIAKVISGDPVLCSRLIRATNSPLCRGSHKIEDIKGAVTRLGVVGIRSIANSYAMEQLYANNANQHPLRKKLLRDIWLHSTHVAALSHVIARDYAYLSAEKAMFSGLIHDIGKLPIIEYFECVPEIFNHEGKLQKVLTLLHGRAGGMIVRSWDFAEDVIAVVSDHEQLHRPLSRKPDYVDVVTIANLLSYIGTDHPCTRMDWTEVSAFANVRLSPEASIEAMKDAHEDIMEIKQLFS